MAEVRWEDRGNARWILLEGELDHQGSTELGNGLLEASCAAPGTVVVDMANVTFVGSHALRLLLEAHHSLRKVGRGLHVHGLNPFVRKVFETTGIFDAIPEFDA